MVVMVDQCCRLPSTNLQVGHTILHRETYLDQEDNAPRLLPLYCQMPELEALMTCVQRRWMAILVCLTCT